MKLSFKNKRVVRYIVVLLASVVMRILIAVLAPIEAQKYIGLIIILLAIAIFFIWDYIDRRKNEK